MNDSYQLLLGVIPYKLNEKAYKNQLEKLIRSSKHAKTVKNMLHLQSLFSR